MKKLITVIIPSYKSGKLIISHLKKISKKINIIVVENSGDIKLKKEIEKKYKNTKIYLQKNIGYGRAINFGANYVKTKYFFVMNPDTVIYKDTLQKLINLAEKIKNFGMICPEHIENKKKKNSKIVEKSESLIGLTAGAMIFKTKIFKKLKGFDENIFLYYEDNDYFKKCILNGYNLYIAKNSFHYHKKKNSSSAIYKNIEEKNYFKLIAGWHGQWSKFYFHKKYDGYFSALLKNVPKMILMIIQLTINLFFNFSKAKYIYFRIEGLTSSIIGLPSFKRSKFDQKKLS
jgi:N-acetylglucosaminyl-diphospho-decaprenol L-rhamnosyltransferase